MEGNSEPLILGCTEFRSEGNPTGPLAPMDLIGHGPDAGRFSWEDGEDGEPRLMITVDKEYLEDFLRIWNTPISK